MGKKQSFGNLLETREIKEKNNPWRTVLIYCILGFLWIYFSDSILFYLVNDPQRYQRIQTYKGWVYVILTSGLLYFIIKIDYSKIFKLSKEINYRNQELVTYTEEIISMDEELKHKIKKLYSLTDELMEQKRFIDDIFNNSNTAIILWNLKGEVIEINNHFTKILGYSNDIIGKNWVDILMPGKDKQIIFDMLTQLKENYKVTNLEHKVITKDGRILDMIWNDILIQNPSGNELVVVSFGVDLTIEKTQERQILEMAFTDELTGLKNRVLFEKEIVSLILRKEVFAIYLIDIDNFKKLNDIHGHQYGDMFLIHYSEILKAAFDEQRLYRWGGDEFLLIEQINESNDIDETIDLLMLKTNQKYILKEVEYYPTISVGITRYPNDGNDVHTLFKNVEMAVYKAKSNGKSRAVYFEDKLKQDVEYFSNIENKLNDAINKDEFELYFQPIYNLKNNKIVSIEVLLRWQSNNISTGEFIAIAEQTGQITKIDQWVIRKTFWFIRERFKNLPPCVVSINLSAQSFNSDEFFDFLNMQIKEYGINPVYIEFEITEHSFINNISEALRIIKEIKSMGFTIALDDFGTMYSSLNYLGKLPFNRLKIDKSYIDQITEQGNDRVIVNQIIQLSDKLGLKTIAEGIEFEQQKEILKELGCNYGQGYYLSKPVNSEMILKMLT